ncbi:unnamed protein product [Lactuca saligna]|uniref:Uncharacterized protein n=1 Tax=Lactuca saligna TaxID=75948 RepID=A0AA35V7H6_LACSI|nr:unnamed protein product [Lactuca saligna]
MTNHVQMCVLPGSILTSTASSHFSCGVLEFRWVFTCHSRISPHRICLIFPHRFLATHIRISPSYRRDDADDHRPDSDLGSHDGTGIGYVPLSSSNPQISLMLPQSVLTTGLTPDLCHRQQPSSHRQLELLTPFRLLLKRCHRGFALLKEMTLIVYINKCKNLWLTMEATVKKFQQKFKRVKDDMDKWDNLHAQLVSQFRNASSIIGRYDHQVASSPVSLCRYCSALIPSTLSFCWTSF